MKANKSVPCRIKPRLSVKSLVEVLERESALQCPRPMTATICSALALSFMSFNVTKLVQTWTRSNANLVGTRKNSTDHSERSLDRTRVPSAGTSLLFATKAEFAAVGVPGRVIRIPSYNRPSRPYHQGLSTEPFRLN